ncbi:hypothetical protein [Massilia endophytica]|uniref:hypothetical protein n=1 Tax=Massilia endophytica TaxID=2899220 RepID=UPI001E36E8C5|nr:hypothetical protein [Massilia endophytica]UGQ46624.1 hypothetical protein LSQ66_23130 [Massilia endophytica]
MRLILRQTRQSTLSADEAEGIVRSCADVQVVSRDGRTMLVDAGPCGMESLRERLSGWLVSEAGPPKPVPDACVHVKR